MAGSCPVPFNGRINHGIRAFWGEAEVERAKNRAVANVNRLVLHRRRVSFLHEVNQRNRGNKRSRCISLWGLPGLCDASWSPWPSRSPVSADLTAISFSRHRILCLFLLLANFFRCSFKRRRELRSFIRPPFPLPTFLRSNGHKRSRRDRKEIRARWCW